eukprot:11086628-Karenia_brevis.AAC.1
MQNLICNSASTPESLQHLLAHFSMVECSVEDAEERARRTADDQCRIFLDQLIPALLPVPWICEVPRLAILLVDSEVEAGASLNMH